VTRQTCRPHVYSAQSAQSTKGCTPRRSPTRAIQIAESTAARAPVVENVNRAFNQWTSPTRFSHIAQLRRKLPQRTASDAAAPLSAERRLQWRTRLVGVDDPRAAIPRLTGKNDETDVSENRSLRAKFTVGVADQGQHGTCTSRTGAAPGSVHLPVRGLHHSIGGRFQAPTSSAPDSVAGIEQGGVIGPSRVYTTAWGRYAGG